jgi:hypothetical protein
MIKDVIMHDRTAGEQDVQGFIKGLIGLPRTPAPSAPDRDAGRRFVEFFKANIRNPATRKAYARVITFPNGSVRALGGTPNEFARVGHSSIHQLNSYQHVRIWGVVNRSSQQVIKGKRLTAGWDHAYFFKLLRI